MKQIPEWLAPSDDDARNREIRKNERISGWRSSQPILTVSLGPDRAVGAVGKGLVEHGRVVHLWRRVASLTCARINTCRGRPAHPCPTDPTFRPDIETRRGARAKNAADPLRRGRGYGDDEKTKDDDVVVGAPPRSPQ
ncbi:hypothetical protein GEV33_014453 [Tenebrio molitor]|uniref:Uncharacterized protein n=1 Tax=Tenebrio molitor TaxID=7067 RepID=A0A8J6H6Q7_TENMO|nr:hypothetical protein GEV33_014453 [Tenebrio molitor]